MAHQVIQGSIEDRLTAVPHCKRLLGKASRTLSLLDSYKKEVWYTRPRSITCYSVPPLCSVSSAGRSFTAFRSPCPRTVRSYKPASSMEPMRHRVMTPRDGERLAQSVPPGDESLEQRLRMYKPSMFCCYPERGWEVDYIVVGSKWLFFRHRGRCRIKDSNVLMFQTLSSPALALPRLRKKSMTRLAAPELPACCPPVP